MSMSLYFGPI